MEDGRLKPKVWDHVSIICMDIVDFTMASNSMVSEKLCAMLTKFYSGMDGLLDRRAVDKVDIIGLSLIHI